jgi:hypothetical protein
MRNYKKWTEEENTYLRLNWCRASEHELETTLGRKFTAINRQAFMNGISGREINRKLWSDSDIQYLTENWVWSSKEELEYHLNRNINAIKRQAYLLKLPRRVARGKNCFKFISSIDGKSYNAFYSRGYALVRINRKNIPLHRVEMEKLLGRKLSPNERVHHKNGIKNDNRPENLILYDNHMRHAHIDTRRAEIAEQFIAEKQLIKEYEDYYESKTGKQLYGYVA